MNSLKRTTLIKLLESYDKYIQESNDENRYCEGWFPVSIGEFYNNEFQEGLYE